MLCDLNICLKNAFKLYKKELYCPVLGCHKLKMTKLISNFKKVQANSNLFNLFVIFTLVRIFFINDRLVFNTLIIKEKKLNAKY